MTNLEKIEYNKKESKRLGWDPSWFNCSNFDETLLESIISFQKECGLVADGLLGDGTYRRILTQREALSTPSIICGGIPVPIDWPKTKNMFSPSALKIGSNFKTKPGRKPSMFIVHWDACLSSASCAKVLDQRGLSVHFCIDNDGTIYQLVDTENIAYHAPPTNTLSIGVEVSNAFYKKYSDTYIKNGFGARPIVPQTKVNGGIVEEHLGFYPEQEKALSVLIKTVCAYYSIPLVTPKVNGQYATGEHPDVVSGAFKGVACHFHVTKEKIDCAGLDLDKIIS